MIGGIFALFGSLMYFAYWVTGAPMLHPSLIGVLLFVLCNVSILIVLFNTKRQEIFDYAGHLQLLTLMAAIFFGEVLDGVRIVNVDGRVAPIAGPSFIPLFPAAAAFIYRSKNITIAYGILPVVAIFTIYTANGSRPGDVDFLAMLVTLIAIALSTASVTLALAYFSASAVTLIERATTARTQMREAMRDAVIERRANAAKTRFVSVMSHEIRNPLQAILLQLEMLEQTALSAKQYDYVKGVGRASSVLLSIVNDVLDVTKIESGAVSLESTVFSMRDLAEDTVLAVAPTAMGKDLGLTLSLPANADPWVRADPTRIRQILHNLLSNALKFTSSGEVHVSVVRSEASPASSHTSSESNPGDESDSSASTPANRSDWTLSVQDTGIGIEPAGQEKLFQEFSQVDDSTTRQYGGTGLGLFICKQLSTLMGGGVSVDSEFGKGSTFRAVLSLEDAPPTAEQRRSPLRMGVSSTRWHVIIYAQFTSLTTCLADYASYFFAACPSVSVVTHSADAEAVSSLRDELRAARKESNAKVLIILDRDATSFSTLATVSKLRDKVGSLLVPVLVEHEVPSDDRSSLRARGYKHTIAKPVRLDNMCTVLAAAAGIRSAQQPPVAESDVTGSKIAYSRHSNVSAAVHDQPLFLPSLSDENLPLPSDKVPVVLIVDDFRIVRELVQHVVLAAGFRARIAANGVEALNAVRESYAEINMIVMDCEMPIMDGYEATRAIREFEDEQGVPEGLRLPICAMTANAMREDMVRCLAAGMNDFLSKPVKRHDLQQMVVKLSRKIRRTDSGKIIEGSPFRTLTARSTKPSDKVRSTSIDTNELTLGPVGGTSTLAMTVADADLTSSEVPDEQQRAATPVKMKKKQGSAKGKQGKKLRQRGSRKLAPAQAPPEQTDAV